MSHIVTGEVQIKASELTALGRAIAHFGVEFRDGQTTHRVYTGPSGCEHAISDGVEGHFEIGLRRMPGASSFELAFDTYGKGRWIAEAFGNDLGKLQDRFLAEVARDEFEAQGMVVEIEESEDGGLVIEGVSYSD